MAEKLDPREVVTFEELLRTMMIEQDAHTAGARTEGPADQRGGAGGDQGGAAGDGTKTKAVGWRGAMKIDEAERLRRAWKEKREKGGPPCDHPVVAKERGEWGHDTGDFVCTTCGMIVDDPKGKKAPDGGTWL